MLAQPDYSSLLTNLGRYTDIVRLKRTGADRSLHRAKGR